jgi:hypothetical protein
MDVDTALIDCVDLGRPHQAQGHWIITPGRIRTQLRNHWQQTSYNKRQNRALQNALHFRLISPRSSPLGPRCLSLFAGRCWL